MREDSIRKLPSALLFLERLVGHTIHTAALLLVPPHPESFPNHRGVGMTIMIILPEEFWAPVYLGHAVRRNALPPYTKR